MSFWPFPLDVTVVNSESEDSALSLWRFCCMAVTVGGWVWVGGGGGWRGEVMLAASSTIFAWTLLCRTR